MSETKKIDKIPTFSGDRKAFPGWARQVKAVLHVLGLEKALMPRAAEELSTKLYYHLTLALEGEAQLLLGSAEEGNGSALWARLLKHYAPPTPLHISALTKELQQLTLERSGGSVSKLITALETVLDQLRVSKADMDQAHRHACSQLLDNLPDKYMAITVPMLADPDKMTWASLTEQVRCVAALEAIRGGKGEAVAAYAGGHNGGAARRNGGGSAGGRGGRGPSQQQQQHGGNRDGHRDGGRDGNRGGGRGGLRNSDGSFRKGCLCCGSHEHRVASCEEALKMFSARNGKAKAHAAVDGDHDDNEPVVFCALAQVTASAVLPGNLVELLVDSGASKHILSSPSLFASLQDMPTSVGVADGRSVLASAVGSAMFEVDVSGGGQQRLELREALYLPGGLNLLSADRLCEQGHSVILSDKPEVRLVSGKIVPLERRGGVFVMRVRLSASNSPTDDSTVVAAATRLSVLQRHERLGHLHEQGMRDIGQLEPGESLPFCEHCALAKSKRKAVPKQAAPRSTKPGQLTHSDLCGPMDVPTLMGARYAVNFIDDATRYTTVYLVKNKDDVPRCFRLYVAKMLTLGVTIGKGCTLQSDNDSVYRGRDFQEWCSARGISQRYSAPHTQAQNGVSERSWNTLVDMARAMVLRAGLDKAYWGLAMMHAAAVRNMCASDAIGGGIPYERLHGKAPDYSRLRAFGAAAYVHVERDQRSKWDPKARKGIYVGFSTTSKTFLVYYADTKKLVESMHVDFDERLVKAAANEGVQKTSSASDDGVTPAAANEPADGGASDGQASDQASEQSGESEGEGDPLLTDLESPARVVHREDSGDEDIDPLLALARTSLVHALSAHALPSDPQSYDEAMARAQAAEWQAATLEECRSIIENNTFTLVPRSSLPRGTAALRSMLLFKTKLDSAGRVERYKARLVVKGCAQRKGIDYDEVFAPVAHHESIRIVMSVAAAKDLRVHQMDVKTAFLIPEVKEEIYMELPKGWPAELPGGDSDGQLVARLNKALYGLKQAPRCWYDKLSSWMIAQDFKASQSDPCLFIKSLSSGQYMYVTVWVDDLLIAAVSERAVSAFKANIAATFSMKDLGVAHFCLGMRFRFADGVVTMDQQRYVGELLERHGMASCNPSPTPLPPGTELKRPLKDDDASDSLLEADKARNYREIVGGLLYLVTCTRPDLAVATNQLARHMSAPCKSHMAAAKHVLRYLRGTDSLGLVFRRATDASQRNVLQAYADASWLSVPVTHRSVSGYAFLFNGAAVSWKCKVQSTIATSSTEAEFDALCAAVREVMYLRGLLQEMGLEQQGPTTIYEDNQPCIALVKNPVTSSRTKHVALRFNFVREKLQANLVQMIYCPTQDMVADIMTKILPNPQHCKLRWILMGGATK
jgi:transposase InsO family protein